jgi:prepilin-type N-terminal cleavage/methylation domain-containing protein
MRTVRKKRGFTLVETVVTVGIIASLAAVVYPTVVKQFDAADPARGSSDLGNIRTALETFAVNVRPQLPKDIEDLANQPDLTTDSTSLGALYSKSEQAAWNGPYLSVGVPLTAGQADTVALTGFEGRVINRLPLYDTNPLVMAGAGDTVATSAAASAKFIAVRIVGLSGAQFNALNLQVDGSVENTATLRRTLGVLRCPAATYVDNNAACANAYFLAVAKK